MKIFKNEIIMKAAHHIGTPLYLYDGEEIRTTYRRLREIVSPSMDIFYSMKANPLLGICEIFQRENAGCEVCSEGELHVALKAGFLPQNIIFVGPGKSLKELELCVRNNIYAVVCESIDELIQLDKLAKSHTLKCNVLLRINPEFSVDNAPLKMGGRPTQFGIDLAVLRRKFEEIISYSNINIRGIHIYNGTRILDAQSIIDNTKRILNLASSLSKEWSIKFDCIDIGGGFGIPYFGGEQDLNVKEVMHGIEESIKHYLNFHPNTRFILECGRYLVGKAGVFISEIISIKNSYGEEFIITDGGMNCHMAATGMGSFIRRNFPIAIIPKALNNNNDHSYSITGPLCTPGDVLARQITLPKVNVGDLVVIKNSGAYGPTASPVRFLSHGFPAEAMLDEAEIILLRKREGVEDILANQISLKNYK